MDKYDLVLQGGTVVDPANGIHEKMDVAILDGKIACVNKSIDSSLAKKTADVKGLYVFPGLIDMHCHIYPVYPRHPDSLPTIDGEPFMFRSGVTTAVDAGTCGTRDFETFKETIIDKSKLRILSFINIARGGMVDLDSEQNPSEYNPSAAAGMAQAYPDLVVGIKTAHYWVGVPYDDIHTPWLAVDKAREAAALCGKPAMFDFQPNGPERTYEDLIVNHMEPGDIHTHVFAQQFHYLDEKRKVADFMFKAKERGIYFDLGHGSGSFWFRNAIPAFIDGFEPDTLSTDLYSHNVCGPVLDLANVMSKFIAIGYSLDEVVRKVTVNPARIINHQELGTLSVGTDADIAVFKIVDGDFGFADSGHARLKGDKRFVCQMTVRGGEVVYDLDSLLFTPWEKAPSSYWKAPGVIIEGA